MTKPTRPLFTFLSLITLDYPVEGNLQGSGQHWKSGFFFQLLAPVPIAPLPPSVPMPQSLYDNFVKVTEEVEGKGVIPYCRVCLDPFEVGKLVGWTYSKTVGNYIGVHFKCHLKPLAKDLTLDEHIKTKKAWNRIHKKPCTCATGVIIQSGCQCGGI